MDAIDYSSAFNAGGVSPMQAFNQALTLGSNIQAQRAAAAQAEAQRLAAEAAAEQQRQINAMWAELDNPDITPAEYGNKLMKIAMRMPKDQSESIQNSYKIMQSDQQQVALAEYGQLFSALSSGRNDVAIQLLRDQASAELSSGNKQGADYANSLADTIAAGPDGAEAIKRFVGINMGFMPKGQEAIESAIKYGQEQREEGLYPAGLRQAEADILKTEAETRKLNAEALKAELEANRPQGTDIDEGARKIMNTAVEAVLSADLVASQADNLSDAFMKYRPEGGWTAKATEAAKKLWGGEDIQTKLKQEYTKLRNSEVLKNLPPGVASDKDIEVAMSAFPDANTNPDLIVSFLRGMSKLQRYSSSVNKAKAEWVNQNGSLGNARSDFTANGQDVKKGMAFWDFTKNIPIPNVTGANPTANTGATQGSAKSTPQTVVTGSK